MKSMTKAVWAVLVTAFVAACATPSAVPTQSLRGADAATKDEVFDSRAWLGKRPGSQEGYTRTYSTQPPLIPHALENFDEVTLADNQCVECHGPANYQKKNAPMLGEKHFVNADVKAGQIAGARYACVMCHVQQSDAPPLVANTFRGDRLVPAAKKP